MSDILFLTVCTTRQIPQALVLADSIRQQHPSANFVIGLADDAQSLADGKIPYTFIPVESLYETERLSELSAQYAPTEFMGAVKPTFIRKVYKDYPDAQFVFYLDVNSVIFQSLEPVQNRLREASLLLTPFLSRAPADDRFPDEKYLQNIGLYNADFLAFRRSDEVGRLLAWWENRVQSRAYIDFCDSLCLDQIWLMHTVAFFEEVEVVQDTTWHRGIWNWHEWKQAGTKPDQKPLWINFKGLYNPHEGFFAHQNRLELHRDSVLQTLLDEYRREVDAVKNSVFNRAPVYGKQPEKTVLFGWRRQTVSLLKSLAHRINTVPLPVWK